MLPRGVDEAAFWRVLDMMSVGMSVEVSLCAVTHWVVKTNFNTVRTSIAL